MTRVKELVSGELEQQLKLSMGYLPPSQCCSNCAHFVATDMSGDIGSLAQHCTLNPAALLPVVQEGRCDFFQARPAYSGLQRQ